MESRFHRAENNLKRIAPLATLMLAGCVGWTLSQLLWLLWPVPEPEIALPPPRASAAGAAAATSIEPLIRANLFGKMEAARPQETAPVDAPETRLNLTLKGIFAYDDPQMSRAIIADGSRIERPYAVGDEIPGGAELNSIESDRVILKRSGRFETLRLERKLGSTASGSSRSGPGSTTGPASTRTGISRPSGRSATASSAPGGGAAASLAAIRTEVLADPSRIQEYVRIQPVQVSGGDGIRGYRIYPGSNRTAFREAGLRAGEVVTSVNGVQLNDPAVALQLLGDVSQANQVTLTLERGGQSREVTLDLSQ